MVSAKWISAPFNYLVPVKVVMPRFRSIFLKRLKELYLQNKLFLKNSKYDNKNKFQTLIDLLFNKKWIVYIKESFKTSESVVKYLAKYTHRIAISNYRIISVKNKIVSFSYRDYVNNNKRKVMEMPVMKFIERFLYHIVPYRFVRIRYYGLMSNSTAKKMIEDCRDYYNIKMKKYIKRSIPEIFESKFGNNIDTCTKCNCGTMKTIRIIDVKSRAGPKKT